MRVTVVFQVIQGIVRRNAMFLQKGVDLEARLKAQPLLQPGFPNNAFPVGFEGGSFEHITDNVPPGLPPDRDILWNLYRDFHYRYLPFPLTGWCALPASLGLSMILYCIVS